MLSSYFTIFHSSLCLFRLGQENASARSKKREEKKRNRKVFALS